MLDPTHDSRVPGSDPMTGSPAPVSPTTASGSGVDGMRLHLPWLALLALALVVSFGPPATLRTAGGDPGDPVGCYMSGMSGAFVTDLGAGTAIVDKSGRRLPIVWPVGTTARWSVGEVEVVDAGGHVLARTGSHISIDGGFADDAWVTCGESIQTIP
jgi:hypothetical protein